MKTTTIIVSGACTALAGGYLNVYEHWGLCGLGICLGGVFIAILGFTRESLL